MEKKAGLKVNSVIRHGDAEFSAKGVETDLHFEFIMKSVP